MTGAPSLKSLSIGPRFSFHKSMLTSGRCCIGKKINSSAFIPLSRRPSCHSSSTRSIPGQLLYACFSRKLPASDQNAYLYTFSARFCIRTASASRYGLEFQIAYNSCEWWSFSLSHSCIFLYSSSRPFKGSTSNPDLNEVSIVIGSNPRISRIVGSSSGVV